MHHSHTQQGVVNESIYVAYDWQIPPNVLARSHVNKKKHLFYSIVLLTDTILLGALVVLCHLRRPNLDVFT